MIQVHFEGAVQEVLAEMRAFVHASTSETASAPVAQVTKEKKEKKAEAPTGIATPAEVARAEAALQEVAKATFQDVKDIIPKIIDKLGKTGIVDLLSKFGAKKGSELKEEDYQKFLDAATKLLA